MEMLEGHLREFRHPLSCLGTLAFAGNEVVRGTGGFPVASGESARERLLGAQSGWFAPPGQQLIGSGRPSASCENTKAYLPRLPEFRRKLLYVTHRPIAPCQAHAWAAGTRAGSSRPANFPDLEAWISDQEAATTEDRLLALVQPLRRYPEQVAQIARSAIARFAKSDPAAAASWLVHAGMAAEALALLATALLLDDPPDEAIAVVAGSAEAKMPGRN